MAKNKIQSVTDQRKFTLVYNDFLESDRLSAREKIVFIILKKYANSDGKCFPSLKTLCKMSGMSKPTIVSILKELEKKEVLTITNRTSEEKGKESNIYTLYDIADMWIKKESLKEATDQSNTSQSSKNKPSVNSILPTDGFSQVHKTFTNEILNEIYDYNILMENNKCSKELVDSIMELLLELLNSNKETIRVNREDKPAALVKGRLLKLNYMHIQYVLDSVGEQTQLIKNKRAYLITSLYNSYTTLEMHVTNLFNHDMQNPT